MNAILKYINWALFAILILAAALLGIIVGHKIYYTKELEIIMKGCFGAVFLVFYFLLFISSDSKFHVSLRGKKKP